MRALIALILIARWSGIGLPEAAYSASMLLVKGRYAVPSETCCIAPDHPRYRPIKAR